MCPDGVEFREPRCLAMCFNGEQCKRKASYEDASGQKRYCGSHVRQHLSEFSAITPEPPEPRNICDLCGQSGTLTVINQRGIAGLSVCEKCATPESAPQEAGEKPVPYSGLTNGLFDTIARLRQQLKDSQGRIDEARKHVSDIHRALAGDGHIHTLLKHEASCALGMAHTLTQERDAEHRETKRLAESIWRTEYKDKAPDWSALDTTAGIISQIDNMFAGIRQERDAARAERDESRRKQSALNGVRNQMANAFNAQDAKAFWDADRRAEGLVEEWTPDLAAALAARDAARGSLDEMTLACVNNAKVAYAVQARVRELEEVGKNVVKARYEATRVEGFGQAHLQKAINGLEEALAATNPDTGK